MDPSNVRHKDGLKAPQVSQMTMLENSSPEQQAAFEQRYQRGLNGLTELTKKY